MRIPAGRVVNGRYRVIDVLGEGGMGVVYRAEQLPLGREVALKVLRLTGSGDESFRQRFFLEASLTSQINHRNLVTKLEIQSTGGTWVALERQQYNYFVAASGLGVGPFTIRLTDIHGQQLVHSGISLSPAAVQTTGTQFTAH